MNIFKTGLVALTLIAVIAVPSLASAATTDIASKIEALLKQLSALQEQLRALQGEVRETLREGLKEGMSNEDVKKIQELLATDPEVYPRGLITGYFGPMTKEAIKRFQWKAGIVVTGDVSSTTRALFEEMLKERFAGHIPPGLLHAPGIYKKFLDRMHDGTCDNSGPGKGMGPFCKQGKDGKDGEDGKDGKDGDDASDSHELEVEVEFEDGDAKVKISYVNGSTTRLTFDNETNHEDIIDGIVDATDLTESEVRDAIEFEDDGNDASDIRRITADIGTSTTTVKVYYKDGDTDTYTYSETDEDDIIELIADELDMDADDVEDLIDFD